MGGRHAREYVPRLAHRPLRAPYAVAVITDVLDAWTPRDPAQASLLAEYRAFVVASGPAATDRSLAPAHLTASCFVLTPDRSRVLLCFHRKGQFWVQLGGHLEPGDASLSAAAYREAREEGGILDLTPGGIQPADLNRHDLSAAFGRCRTHWDVGFVAYAPASSVPVVSVESEQVAWFDVDALPERTPEDFALRLRTVLAELEG
ncbi:NUDIX domain-containing protein [Cellulomonas sp. zg-ZUI188]|uniref:NUDIX domain-containing protein n=1 Tax=Cellulomonas fengjieae TaxID=2819978 RepID=A0ABS3SJX9_9CELL|nr:NUDIX domain-containing protein [Cellulomonas fengjieae]QVI65879.1 NUDIX domain-containing protein [Cellulomonas fengjieae]